MSLADDLLGAVTDVGVEEEAMEARVKQKTDALDAQILALQANPNEAQTQQAIAALKAEKAKLVAFAATPNPGETPPGEEPPVTEQSPRKRQ